MNQKILYILVPDSHISPFDVTLAADSGFTHVLPFINVSAKDVVPIIQDALFARGGAPPPANALQ